MNLADAIAVAIILVALLLIVYGLEILRRRFLHPKLNSARFKQRWQEIQQQCQDKTTWPLAVIDADKLLDEALKKSGFKGKSMGERMVSARKRFNNNDKAWFAHKLRNKLVHEENVKLNEPLVRDALKGFRNALRDLGAL